MSEIPIIYTGHSRDLDALIRNQEAKARLERVIEAFEQGVKQCQNAPTADTQ